MVVFYERATDSAVVQLSECLRWLHLSAGLATAGPSLSALAAPAPAPVRAVAAVSQCGAGGWPVDDHALGRLAGAGRAVPFPGAGGALCRPNAPAAAALMRPYFIGVGGAPSAESPTAPPARDADTKTTGASCGGRGRAGGAAAEGTCREL